MTLLLQVSRCSPRAAVTGEEKDADSGCADLSQASSEETNLHGEQGTIVVAHSAPVVGEGRTSFTVRPW